MADLTSPASCGGRLGPDRAPNARTLPGKAHDGTLPILQRRASGPRTRLAPAGLDAVREHVAQGAASEGLKLPARVRHVMGRLNSARDVLRTMTPLGGTGPREAPGRGSGSLSCRYWRIRPGPGARRRPVMAARGARAGFPARPEAESAVPRPCQAAPAGAETRGAPGPEGVLRSGDSRHAPVEGPGGPLDRLRGRRFGHAAAAGRVIRARPGAGGLSCLRATPCAVHVPELRAVRRES